MEPITRENLSKIKEKITQAASEGLSKSAQIRSSYTLDINAQQQSLSPQQQHQSAATTQTNNRSKNLWNCDLMQTNNYFDKTHYETYSISHQEQIMVKEIIYCLSGMRGTYIHPITESITSNSPGQNVTAKITNEDEYKHVKFKISDRIQSSFRDIILEILPAASHYSIIRKFTQQSSTINNGQVLQALSAALRTLLYDYYLFLVQLESEQNRCTLSLHKLLYFIRPTIATLEILSDIIMEIDKMKICGGIILTLLYNKIQNLTGDKNSQNIVIYLIQMAAIPYIEILELWILKGIIIDPQEEFFIEDNEIIRREEVETDHYSADYWEKRYTIRRERIPIFLDNVSDIILRTGKYLNVIAQCGNHNNIFINSTVEQPMMKTTTTTTTTNTSYDFNKKLQFNPMNQNHIQYIQNAFQIASRCLLEVLMKENDLMGHLLSVKRYLLLQQGDFIAQFMDASEDELLKNVDKILPMKLENLLGLTLRLSSAKCDPYKDDLHCQLFPFELVKQMSKIHLAGSNEEEYWQNEKIDLCGLECFAFRYEVQWPISLVLNHFAILEYQMLFRQLFYCKHVERQLCKIWKDNNNAKKFSSDTAELYRSAFTLRQRMMNAIQNLEYYMMIEVIEPAWHEFIEKINQVENIDDVFIVHQEFLDVCLQNCMLKNPDLLRSVTKLCNICLNFCKFIQKTQHYFIDAELTSMLRHKFEDSSDSESEISSYKQSESSMAPSDTFSERIKRFDLEFTFLLIGLFKQINDLAFENPSGKFINLIHRINFNSFYNDQLELLCTKQINIK